MARLGKRLRTRIGPAARALLLAGVSIGLLAGHTPMSAAGPERGLSDEPYAFPLDPEADPVEWAEHDPDEAIELNMAPADVLDQMSVAGLAETLLEHPSFESCVFHDEVASGVESLRRSTNVLDELLARRGGRDRLEGRLAELREATSAGESPRLACLAALVSYLDDSSCAANLPLGADHRDPAVRAAAGCEP